jgi:hypothetical protein
MDDVTTPVTTVDGSPALNESTVSLCHSTPMLFLMRSMMSCAVTAARPPRAALPPSSRLRRTRRWARARSLFMGPPAAATAASATKSRREISVIEALLVSRSDTL